MAATAKSRSAPARRRRSILGGAVRALVLVVFGFYALVALSLVFLRWVNPITTAVQAERRVQSWFGKKDCHKVYVFLPLEQISPALQHAVVAAEDTRFYQHHGFDWKEVQNAVEDDLDRGRRRGASTITQQLVKNLYLSTSRSFIRKGVEFSIVPLAELVLSKKRILELYLNVIEWGALTR